MSYLSAKRPVIQMHYDGPMQQDDLEVMAAGRFLRLVKKGRWEYVDRPHTTGAVAVIAVTDDEELVLIEQHRVPMGRPCIEIPAGLAGDMDDDPDESFLQTARRELLEETGFSAQTLKHLYPIVTSPGLSSEVIDLYRATGLARVHEGGGVEGESIQVHLVPLSEVDGWLAGRAAQGTPIDIKVYTAAVLAKAWQQGTR